jgi:mono/diheme cytochrome c family protein
MRISPAAAGFSLFAHAETVPRQPRRALGAAFALLLAGALAGNAFAQGDAKRGEYLAQAGGCVGCHTEDKQGAVPFVGGRALTTPFGTFYGPNITPHPQAGIGHWTEGDFIRAMREGTGPGGSHYFPAFPYPSFTRLVDGDLRDLFAYVHTLPPNARPS